ncbi:MAG: protocatechuate 3,4-dioxygenase subunit beta [Pseudomonadota bacterium]
MADPVGYRRPAPGTQPDYLHAAYQSTVKRSPTQKLVVLPHTLTEVTGPLLGRDRVGHHDDLTKQHKGEPIGERIIVGGQILDEDGRAVSNTLVELWQCNATGRYHHAVDQHDAPLDPNFTGAGRVLTDDQGRYQFTTIRPGAYPWRNHYNGWRPAHLHFSVFGASILTRLVTQMYFPGDPLLPLDPIFNCVDEPAARDRMICSFELERTVPEFALGYRFDMVLRGRNATPMVG